MNRSFVSHLLKYVGVGLISGSIVHFGTLGGTLMKYVVLILIGMVAFSVGTALERQESHSQVGYIAMSVIVSIGIGMVSGGTQHYLDDPQTAAYLIPIGLVLGYIAFGLRDFREQLRLSAIMKVGIIAIALGGVLYQIGHRIDTDHDHHAAAYFHSSSL